MITHLLYILMIDETYRAQNEQQRPLQDLSTLPKLLSVKHSLPRRVPTTQADHYSKRASSMFNIYTIPRTVNKFKVSKCELMMVW